MVCRASGCAGGQVPCPGPCLKLSVGRWEHLEVAGHDPKELWQKFYGSGGWQAWSQGHVGEVVVIREGKPVNIGAFPVCHKRATVDCKFCKGAGKLVCPVCGGAKQVTESRASEAAANPRNQGGGVSAKQAGDIKLKDGRTINGKIIAIDENTALIKTSDGKTLQVPASELGSPP